MYTHLRELCWGRAIGEDEQEEDDESVGSEEECVAEDKEENVDLDEIFEEVEDLEKTFFGEENMGARRKEKRTISSSSSSSPTPRRPPQQRLRVNSPPLTPPMAIAIYPSPVTSPYNLDLGPLLVPREVRDADLLLDIPEVSATTAALVNVVLEDRDQDTRPGTRPGRLLKLDHLVCNSNRVPLQVS